MRARGAVMPDRDMVYTDSSYFIDHATCMRLLEFYTAHKPIQCEIDAYGDFLQALGPKATPEYTQNSANVVAVESNLEQTRLALFQHLRGTQLNVVLCEQSKFYHIGTMEEYLEHYCSDDDFRFELALQPVIFSKQEGRLVESSNARHCFIHSIAASSFFQSDLSVVEYCRLGEGCTVAAKSVLSFVQARANTHVPTAVVLQTVPLKAGCFVTFGFGSFDDFKAKYEPDRARCKLKVFGEHVHDILHRLDCLPTDFWADTQKEKSLWTMHLFEVCDSPETSLASTLQLIERIRGGSIAPGSQDLSPPARVSMPEVLARKDLEHMIRYSQLLAADIRSS
eukprot:m.16135 g.16135  ORF g.16135 m.16135 type:complete len:338 (+) comp27753_c0_seq1:174-1187(+)